MKREWVNFFQSCIAVPQETASAVTPDEYPGSREKNLVKTTVAPELESAVSAL